MSEASQTYNSPLLSFDIYLEFFDNLVSKLRSEKDTRQISSLLSEELPEGIIKQIHKENYDALVLTNLQQHIVWVSQGFGEMTGYSKKFALGKKPDFLQGNSTSQEIKNKIRKSLNGGLGFEETLLNYRKNGEAYLCQIKAIPLFDSQNRLTHYLAFETELKAA
ncbi:PAS domain-containing protein [Poritiphilus flavus]|uniref:PAS domain-containing protein n=1 Tax=Poritiphilus flavus TaxID=2697053 RepID=A0A6L9EE55_9FLAO|nr:PAS domain-containing protein [Poritiphilus flavus]NAS12921.1 PAS domain-containing protein [Poritiphilus flavus]